MVYPVRAAELAMLESHSTANPLEDLEAVTDAAEIAKLIDVVNGVHVADAVKRYAIALVTATRSSPELRLGASPRATLHLIRAARAAAALDGRDFVLPDDVQALAGPVLVHRLLPAVEAQIGGRTPDDILVDVLRTVSMPEQHPAEPSP